MSRDALASLVDTCRQHTAGIGADLLTIEAGGANPTKWAAMVRLRHHADAIDAALTAALLSLSAAQTADDHFQAEPCDPKRNIHRAECPRDCW
jgi:exosome complex RNA-binding protein Rrp42 (RNase PH superfamily)